MSTLACCSDLYTCGVSVHGAAITPELVKDLKSPMMFLPASDDPPLDTVEEFLKSKPIGKDCVFHRFDNMIHGFAAARGNWDDPETRKCIEKALSMSQNFLGKFAN